jgi:hypothetical protein
VIASMVQDELEPSMLMHLAGVITVGTPYLIFRRNSLFSSLGLLGKSLFVSTSWFCSIFAIYMILDAVLVPVILSQLRDFWLVFGLGVAPVLLISDLLTYPISTTEITSLSAARGADRYMSGFSGLQDAPS